MVEDATGETNPESPRQQQRISEYVVRGELPEYYANNVTIKVSPWDFAMEFGVILEADEQLLRVRNDVKVFLSPQHAKAFAEILTAHVREYENQVGKISLPTRATADGVLASQ